MIKYVLLLDIHISVARGCAFSFSQIFVIYNDLIAEPLLFASTTKGKLDMVLIFFSNSGPSRILGSNRKQNTA